MSGNAWFPGLSLAIDPAGNVIDELLQDEGMVLADVSRRALSAARAQTANALYDVSDRKSTRAPSLSRDDEPPCPF